MRGGEGSVRPARGALGGDEGLPHRRMRKEARGLVERGGGFARATGFEVDASFEVEEAGAIEGKTPRGGGVMERGAGVT